MEACICYSKEVSLIASALIFLNSLILFLKNRIKTRLKTSIKYLTVGYLFIGLHQLFEYLSILTGNQVIYKTGLLFSISSMFFNMKSLEVLTQKKHGSHIIVCFIIALAIYLYFFKTMQFNNEHFYVRGEDHFLWGTLWMFFFIFWNFSYLSYFLKIKNKTLRTYLLKAPLYSLNLSFFLATLYSYSAGLITNFLALPSEKLTSLCGGIFSNFEIVFDAPSIWCAFSTLQGFFLIRLFHRYSSIQNEEIVELNSVQINPFFIFCLTSISVFFIFLTLPIFSALSYKMILK